MNKIKTIVDTVGRVIIGRESETKKDVDNYYLENPAIMSVNTVQPDPSKAPSLQVQLFPYMFKEFLTNETTPCWKFPKANVVEPCEDIEYQAQLIQQYETLIEGKVPPQSSPTETEEPDIVKLFDDEE